MINLPAKFESYLNKGRSKPVTMVKLADSLLESIKTSKAEWTDNTNESTVDYDTSPGDVLLEADTIPDEDQLTNDALVPLIITSIGYDTTCWQSFKQTTGRSKILDVVKIYCDVGSIVVGLTVYFHVSVHSAKSGTQLSGVLTYSRTTIGSSFESFDFSGDNVIIENNTTYWIRVYGTKSSPAYWDASTSLLYQTTTSSYANGQLDRTGSDTDSNIGDLYFSVSFTGYYFVTSGSITTQTINLGTTPTVDGEWVLGDSTPSQYGTTAVTYTGYGHTADVFGSASNLGAVTDGLAITGTKYPYYWITAALTTTNKNESPILQSAGVSFTTYVTYTNQSFSGYEQSVDKISSLATSIDDFELTTVGQISVTLGLTESLATYLNTVYPKNKPAKVLLGFIPDSGDTFTESDFLLFYQGAIEKYQISSGHWVTVTIKDNNQNWKVDVPVDTTGSTGGVSAGTFTNIVATADHPVDVMLDILQDQLTIRDSDIDLGSFEVAKTTLTDWEVTRTITGADQEKADELLNELRVLMSAYFIPQVDGKITLKLFDDSEAAVADLTDDNFLTTPTYDANLEGMINKTFIEFDYTTDYDWVWIGIDTTSITNHNQTITKELEDKWTVHDTQGDSQISALTTNLITRYADAPAKISTTLDYKWLNLEVGDIVTITTVNAPSSDFAGISEVPYQITNRNLDPNTYILKYTFLRA